MMSGCSMGLCTRREAFQISTGVPSLLGLKDRLYLHPKEVEHTMPATHGTADSWKWQALRQTVTAGWHCVLQLSTVLVMCKN